MLRAIAVLFIGAVAVFAAASQSEALHRPLAFEPNQGQFPAQVEWIARGRGYQLALTSEGMTMMIREGAAEPPKRGTKIGSLATQPPMSTYAKSKYSTVRMKLTGSRPWTKVSGLEPTGTVSNYLIGNDPKAWRTKVPQFARISAASVYNGIDLVFYSRGGDLEYDFVVAPGADPNQIRLAFEGQDRMHVDEKSGDLVLITAGGSEVRQIRPKVYQQVGDKRVEVAAAYELLDRGRAAFTLASYDRRRALVIDPAISFQKWWFASGQDEATSLAVDSNGNAYVTGFTDSFDFLSGCGGGCQVPRENPNALQQDHPGRDAFVLAMSPYGGVQFVTYLGGGKDDVGWGIAVDSTGVYVTGATASGDFPHQSSKQTSIDVDVFVSKILLDGTGILYTAIVGGSGDDAFGSAIAVDPVTHFAYVTGSISTSISLGPFGLSRYDQPSDVLVFFLNETGGLLRSVRMSGKDRDWGTSIALDHNGGTWVVGQTCSSDFPVGAHQASSSNGCVGFIAKWQPLLSSLQFSLSSYGAKAVAVDANDNAFVVGDGTPDALAFNYITINKLDASGGYRGYASIGPSNPNLRGNGIAVNASGEVYITGVSANSTGFVAKFSTDLWHRLYMQEIGYAGDADVGIAVHDPSPFSLPQIYIAATNFAAPGNTMPASSRDVELFRIIDDQTQPASAPFLRLRNFAMQNEYINIESGPVVAGPIQPGWWSAQWLIEVALTRLPGDPPGETVYRIRNRWKLDEYLNIESGFIQSTPVQPGWWSARWTLEPVRGTNAYQIRNVWQRDKYLNIANGVLTAGPRVLIPLPTNGSGAVVARPPWYWGLQIVN